MKPYIIGLGRRGSEIARAFQQSVSSGCIILYADTDREDLNIRPESARLPLGGQTPSEDLRYKDIEYAFHVTMRGEEHLRDRLRGARVLFLVTGTGGGTGPGATRALASISRGMGLPTVALFTVPFRIEGEKRSRRALMGRNQIVREAGWTLSFHQEALLPMADPSMSVRELMQATDETMAMAIRGLLHATEGADDLSAFVEFMNLSPTGVFGYGLSGESAGLKSAVGAALTSPFLSSMPLTKTMGWFLVLCSRSPLPQDDVEQARSLLLERMGRPAYSRIRLCLLDSLKYPVESFLYATGDFGEPLYPSGVFYQPAPLG